MIWQICIRYPNGQERVIRSCHDREVALRYIDAIYSHGYPMHVAYVVRQAEAPSLFIADLALQHWQPV